MLKISQFNQISEMIHLLKYSVTAPSMSLERGMLIISTDVDVGDPKIGIINRGKRDKDVSSSLTEYRIGGIENFSIPMFIKILNDFEIPITIAIRGQLTEIDSQVMEVILTSHVKHDVGSHGYYHRQFCQLTHEEAENDIAMATEGMKKYSISPKSFIYPKNCVAHLDLLEKHGYLSYRSNGGVLGDQMYIEKIGKLYRICPSLFIDYQTDSRMLKLILDIAIRERLPLHLWFHFWNFGYNMKSVSSCLSRLFIPFFKYVKEKQETGQLQIHTMLSASRKMMMHENHA